MFQPLTEPARQRCEEVIRSLSQQTISVAQTRQLSDELGERLARLVLSSATLQSKANAKLGDGFWWSHERSLQQTTPWQVARLKASWLGPGTVYDLCCGIGGDAIQLGKEHAVVAVDADADVCLMAYENTRRHAVQNVDVVCGNVIDQNPGDSYVHIDPDRRVDDRRTVDPDQYSPNWNEVTAIMKTVRGGIVKLAPAAPAMPIDRDDVHRVWHSLAGTVREQSLLVGEVMERFTKQARRSHLDAAASAIVIDKAGHASSFCPTAPREETDFVTNANEPTGLMVDPDAAIRSAGLTEAFAAEFGLQTLGGPSGFLTGDRDAARIAPLAICETTVWHGSCDDRRLRRELRARKLYPWRVKTRGVSQDPNQLEKKLRDCGDQPCSLWIGKNGKRRYAVMTVPS